MAAGWNNNNNGKETGSKNQQDCDVVGTQVAGKVLPLKFKSDRKCSFYCFLLKYYYLTLRKDLKATFILAY